jgi:hypothetical protein
MRNLAKRRGTIAAGLVLAALTFAGAMFGGPPWP